MDLASLVADWNDEVESLAQVLRELSDEQWALDTPAPGWTVQHQVAHLAWTERALLMAIDSPDQFGELKQRFALDPTIVDRLELPASASSLLPSWFAVQREAAQRVLQLDARSRIDWFAVPMSLTSAVSARIMETFAHGQDVRDAVGEAAVASPRLRHVAHLAVAARGFSFQNRGLEVPTADIRVELSYEDEVWGWGPEDAAQSVAGDALDFALLVTRRRHREDCEVTAVGPDADAWLDIAQAYAGPPGEGRAPLNAS